MDLSSPQYGHNFFVDATPTSGDLFYSPTTTGTGAWHTWLVGGLGAAPGANIGEKAAIFEAVHGSAPDIAGKGIANPTALLLAAGLMLDHVGLPDQAKHLRKAIDDVLNVEKIRTGDLGGKASTSDLAKALVQRLGSAA